MIKHSKYPVGGKHNSLGSWAMTQRRFYIQGEHRFAALLEQLPWWQEYVEEENSSVKNKKLLLAMAKNGELKPNRKHPLGHNLYRYTNKNVEDNYDPVFDKEIRALRPDWFIDNCQDKKNKLLAMAKNGESKPNTQYPLGRNLYRYINKNDENYDPVFDKEIRALRPDWFVTRYDYCKDKKNKLLAMANNGESKPNIKHLCMDLYCYTNKNNKRYDPVFDKQIRRLRPNWFACQDKKNQLLAMAKNDELKPNRKHPLGRNLYRYTTNNKKNNICDPIFDAQIRKLAPHWFK